VEEVATSVEDLAGKLGGELGQQAQAAAAKLRELGQQEKSIQEFLALQTQVGAAERALKQLAGEADAYAAQIAQSGPPTAQEAAQLDKLRTAAAGASSALDQQKLKLSAAASEMQRHGIATDGASRALARVRGDISQTAQGIGQLDPKLSKVVQGWRGVGDAAEQSASRAGKAAGAMGQVASRLGAQLAAAFAVKGMVTAAQDMEKLHTGLKNVSGSATQAGKDMDFVRGVAARVGADVQVVGRSFLSLAEATRGTALQGEATRQVFDAVATAMGKAGKSGEDTAGAIDVLTRMANKGVVTSRELRMQLGDAVPGALDAAAKGLGITTGEMLDMVDKGQVLASDLFPAITKGLNDMYSAAPQAKTLGQELDNVKNAFVGMASHIGENGGMDALKKGAQVAETAIVLLDAAIVAVGKSIGTMVGALVTMDFSQVKQAFADIEREAQDKMLKAAQHNDVMRGYVKAVGAEAMQTKLALQDQGKAAEQAGQQAAGASEGYVALATAYGKVNEYLTQQISLAEKNVTAAKARGDASVAEAKLLGDETALRKAMGKAADDEAKALAELSGERQIELASLQAELKNKEDVLKASGDESEERKKEIAELKQRIAQKAIEADTTRAQAAMARDNARAMGAEAQAATAALDAARARTTTRVADAKAGLSLLETQKELSRQSEEMYRLMGNEEAARQERIKQIEIDIKITRAKAEVARAEAEGAIAVAEATKAELKAKGQLTPVKEAEIDASIKIAQAKLKESDAIKESARLTEMAVANMRNFGNEAGRAADQSERATGRAAKGWNDVASATDKASKSAKEYGDQVQKLGGQTYNKDGWASDESGKALSFGMNESSFNQYIARNFGEQFIGNQAAMKAANLKMNLDYWDSMGLKDIDGSMGDMRRELERLKREMDKQKEQDRLGRQQKPEGAGGASTQPGQTTQAGAGVSKGAGATYVNNITLGGQKYTVNAADAGSQQALAALLRQLTDDKARAA